MNDPEWSNLYRKPFGKLRQKQLITVGLQPRVNKPLKKVIMNVRKHKMQIEIWSDIMCPFCYIGKRKFETALAQFPDKENIEVIWKSFQLAPGLKTQPGKNIHQFLSEHKEISVQQAKSLNDQVAYTANQAGLDYEFDKTIPANTFNAHRLSHLAKHDGLQNEMEEKLFAAYFTEGKNVDDTQTLVQLGTETGLDSAEVKKTLESNKYADEVRSDIYEAQQAGIHGVPFFLFDRKLTVSGAQDSRVFLETLEKSFGKWRKENPEINPEVLEG